VSKEIKIGRKARSRMTSKAQEIALTIEPKRRGRQRSLEAESAVLTATSKLLETNCLCKVPTEAIALLSGVSKATIYKWWPNKTLVALDAFLMRMSHDVPTPDTGSAQKDFTEQVKSMIVFYTSPAGRAFCQFIAEVQSDPAFLVLFRERFLKSRREDVRVIWQRGVARAAMRCWRRISRMARCRPRRWNPWASWPGLHQRRHLLGA